MTKSQIELLMKQDVDDVSDVAVSHPPRQLTATLKNAAVLLARTEQKNDFEERLFIFKLLRFVQAALAGARARVTAEAAREIQSSVQLVLRRNIAPDLNRAARDVLSLLITLENNVVEFPHANEGRSRVQGLMRALVANNVRGVTDGFKRELDIVGVGYRAEVKGKEVVFALGYSHPVRFAIPEGIEIAVEPKTNHITITGIDKQKVGQTAAEIRSLREPDLYKGKGIKYSGEMVRRKAGKVSGK